MLGIAKGTLTPGAAIQKSFATPHRLEKSAISPSWSTAITATLFLVSSGK